MIRDSIRIIAASSLVLTCLLTLPQATTSTIRVRQPQLANIDKLIVEFWIFPFGVYPDQDTDVLEDKIRTDVVALLSQAGFEILPEFSDYDEAPALMFDVASAWDKSCHGMTAVHANARLLDYVSVRRPTVGRVHFQAQIWRYQRHGDTFLLSRQDGPDTLERWAHDATLSFIASVKDAANLELEPHYHE
jgi:hypothetical protein